MQLHDLLLVKRNQVIEAALQSLSRAALPHYSEEAEAVNRARLERLLDLTVRCLAETSLVPITEHARVVARERLHGGFGLQEVHTAFNVLEEAVWRLVTADMAPPDLVKALGQASTILGAGKQALALEYVNLVGHGEPQQSLDLSELFKGTA